jgi:hypothetical protein
VPTQAVFYRDPEGVEPVDEFIAALMDKRAAKIDAFIDEYLNGRSLDAPPPEFPISSQVDGELRADVTHFDLLRACFPAGTVSGAPKVRAMQIISELEGVRRGPYAGAVGYALGGEVIDTCIAIRTIVLHEGVARMQAGAGIVAESDPSAEHRECLNKLAALEAAVDLAEREIA